MAFNYLHDFDNEFLKYLETRFFAWQQNMLDSETVVPVVYDGQDGRELRYVPIIFRHRHIHEKPLTVEQILRKNSGLTYPFVLVTPLDDIDLRDQVPYVEPVSVVDSNDPDVVREYNDNRRVQFQYQLEGISDNWIDHRFLQDLLSFKVVPIRYNQAWIPLFGRTHTVYIDAPTLNADEESNKYRALVVLKIETSITTQAAVEYQTVLERIVNIKDRTDTDFLYDNETQVDDP